MCSRLCVEVPAGELSRYRLWGSVPQQATTFSLVLCPVYLREEAYLMLHDGNAAAAEFQKFIDHYGLVVNFPWGALARLGAAPATAEVAGPLILSRQDKV